MAYRFPLGNVAALWVACACASQAAEPGFEALNETFGVPIWADGDLWDDADAAVAARVGLPLESRTSRDASFRAYTGPDVRVLGARPYSVALYGGAGKASEISMVFANRGDWEPTAGGARGDGYKKAIADDTIAIGTTLSNLLGPPRSDRFGSGQRTRENVSRWDWKGHAILLAAPRDEYVAVRILPSSVADGEFQERVPDSELREELKARVEHRDNGDVILTDIPMVNQGPKGYCVPATWERALRYMGIPADMYVLAMAAGTETGGGTSVRDMMAAADEVIRRNGRRLSSSGGRITPRSVARYIDAGLPILWAMSVVPELDRAITGRSIQREQVSDWEAYLTMLKAQRRAAGRLRTERENGHVCMIIGYNEKTDEIAISDSWGPEFAERWITSEEANAISQNDFTIITW